MSCAGITYRDNAWRHFCGNYWRRGIDRIVGLKELVSLIRLHYSAGRAVEDIKHPGLEGPRYEIRIPQTDRCVVVIVEKTPDCLLPITLWAESP